MIDLEGLVVRAVDHIPGRGGEAMELPTDEQAGRFIAGVRAAQSDRLEQAEGLVDPLGYRVRTVIDSATGRAVHLFQEQQAVDGRGPHGWGMYVVASNPERRLVVEVPHPVFDIGTAEVGVAAFREAGAAVLLIAGTHRYANRDGSSDVAHDARTMFARVNQALVARGDVVLQPHGFDADRAAAEGAIRAADVVVSSGDFPPSAVVMGVASALRSSGFDVCVFDGTRCAALAGTGNVEGAWCREVGAGFVHLELSRTLRSHRRTWMAAVNSAIQGVAASTDVPVVLRDAG